MKKLQAYCKNEAFLKALSIPEDTTIHFIPLAQGEYHKNFLFQHPVTNKKYVFRINYGSQMHLKNQIAYEFGALQLLKKSGRTPLPVFLDDSKQFFSQGILVMEFIEGHPLSYETDLKNAASCLADVHATKILEPHKLIEIKNPIMGILDECEEMFKIYKESDVSNSKTVQTIRELMDLAYEKARQLHDTDYQNVCINTELNNHNFIVDDTSGFVSMIDWEKPLLGDPAQDIGHMLAPTTSFWKTDVILENRIVQDFITDYQKAVNGRIHLGDLRARVNIFLPVTCLRGITWCAMAYVEYMQPGRVISNPDTFEKLKAYLSDAFLEKIRTFLLT